MEIEEIEVIIKTILLCIQWLALGVKIGFREASDNYTQMKSLVKNDFEQTYLDNRIKDAELVSRICNYAIFVILIIVIAI